MRVVVFREGEQLNGGYVEPGAFTVEDDEILLYLGYSDTVVGTARVFKRDGLELSFEFDTEYDMRFFTPIVRVADYTWHKDVGDKRAKITGGTIKEVRLHTKFGFPEENLFKEYGYAD